VGGIFVVWPMGVLQLNFLKGYLQLAYMALYRKTFAPLGTFEMLAMKWLASPLELSVLVLGSGWAVYFYMKARPRPATWLPGLIYVALFFVVLLKVTLEYTYYYAPLAVAMSLLCGLAVGECWRYGSYARGLAVAAVSLSVVGTTVQFAGVLADLKARRPCHFAVLDFVRQEKIPADKTLYLPFQLVPTLHYYQGNLKTAGYDLDWTTQRLAEAVTRPEAHERVLCEMTLCRQLAEALPGRVVDRKMLDPAGPFGDLLYTVRIVPAAAVNGERH
jgi:hypothetical protein